MFDATRLEVLKQAKVPISWLASYSNVHRITSITGKNGRTPRSLYAAKVNDVLDKIDAAVKAGSLPGNKLKYADFKQLLDGTTAQAAMI